MKKTILLLCVIFLLTSCSSLKNNETKVSEPKNNEEAANDNSAKNKEMTLSLGNGQRTGKYTGSLNEDGLPHGIGTFTSQNLQGEKWTYTGEFENGTFEGEGEIKWEDGYFERGTYHDGDLVPMELTNSLFAKIKSDIDSYVGYYVDFTAAVFNVIGYDENGFFEFQAAQDIENFDNFLCLYTDVDVELDEQDYVHIIGRIDGNYDGENITGVKISQPIISAGTCEKISYIDACSPTIATVEVNETQTQRGYSVTVEKVEFAKNETRIYLQVENNGANKFSIWDWGSEIEQNNMQYSYQTNWSANYPEITKELRPGNISNGILVFPQLEIKDFNIYLDVQSEDWNEKLTEMTFNISVEN